MKTLHSLISTHYQLYFVSLSSKNKNNKKGTDANNKKLHNDTNTNKPCKTENVSVLSNIKMKVSLTNQHQHVNSKHRYSSS